MVAFKGVFLEGVEVAIIVISLGGSQHRLGLAAVGRRRRPRRRRGRRAPCVARQLSEVPENAIKWGVGIMLTSLGLFWMGEGVGLHWPGDDLAIPVLIGVFLVASLVAVRLMRAPVPPAVGVSGEAHA